MSFKVVITKSASKEYSKINEPHKSLIKQHIDDLQIFGLDSSGIKPLTGNLQGLFRIRAGKFRIIFKNDDNIFTIISILHRKDAYR
ncbi:MAG: type II toxin-antitoxin system RelE/ParE family toxin [Candidatus Kapabacteria bacterium]|nr:type II toxin-antitoxin system RelE/ParE family toxin [Candidatus Kapabacteria bacterium]